MSPLSLGSGSTMCILRSAKWRFLLVLVPAFVAWTLLIGPLLPIYARAVVLVAQQILRELRPHGAQITFTRSYPDVKWQISHPTQGTSDGSVSFRLLSYNLALYLALLTAIPRVRPAYRIILLLTGLPLFLAFHMGDLLLTVESKMLTGLQPQHYAFWRSFNLWFIAVKFYQSFSVMALKQTFPFLVALLQWHGLKKTGGLDTRPVASAASGKPSQSAS